MRMCDRLTGLLCKSSFARFMQRSSADWPKMKTCLTSFRESILSISRVFGTLGCYLSNINAKKTKME